MAPINQCPPAAALSDIPAVVCGVKFDQIVKTTFQRKQSAKPFNGTTDLITDLANWTVLKAATDSTKVVTTPYFAEFVIPASEGQEEGGNSNETVNGLPIYLGEGFVTVNGVFRNLSEEVHRELKKLSAESVASYGEARLTVFFLNRFKQIIHKDDEGFEIFNFRISEPGSEGYNTDNKFNFSFSMAAGWSEGFKVTTPDFNPLSQL